MKKHIQKLAFLVFSLVLILSCSKDDTDVTPVDQNGGDIFRSQIVTLNISNVSLSANEYQGMLGSQNIVLQKADDNRLLFSVSSSTPLGAVDLVIPALNNTVIHYDVKDTVLSSSVDVTMTPFFSKLDAVVLDNPVHDAALQSSIASFHAVYDNLTTEEKTEMAIIYKANSALINNILINNFSVFERNQATTSGIISSITLHKTAVLGIAAGAILFELGVHPGVKAIGAVIAGVSTGYAIEYFEKVIDDAAIRFGLVADNIIGINDRVIQNSFITFQTDVQKTINLNTQNRKLIASDANNTQSDIVTFFKYHNRFNYIIGAINDKITWINNNVIFANFGLIGLETMPTTSTQANVTVNAVDFSKFTFSVSHPNLQLISSTLQSDGLLNIKLKIIGTPATLPVVSHLNYAFNDDINSFSGKLPIEVANFNSLTIGDSFQGGIVAYIFLQGDPGYVSGEVHGLIASATDQGSSVTWGCSGTYINWANSSVLLGGKQNTIDIVNGCAEAGIAARLCFDLVLNNYDDWYLPSKDELEKLYINKALIGGFANEVYWTSTQSSTTSAWYINFNSGLISPNAGKFGFQNVRAIRSF